MLKNLSKDFELVVFTASFTSYAGAVIDLIDPNSDLFAARLSRDYCVRMHDDILIKDLRMIQNRNLEDMIIVDNSLYCFGLQINRGIPIYPFY
jgi:CTD small phosphatase-like protein 2